MAEIYLKGKRRIFYQTSGSKDVNQVYLTIYHVETDYEETFFMFSTDEGLYYLDYVFNSIGAYLVTFYEDNKRKHRQGYFIMDGMGGSSRHPSGPNIINI